LLTGTSSHEYRIVTTINLLTLNVFGQKIVALQVLLVFLGEVDKIVGDSLIINAGIVIVKPSKPIICNPSSVLH